MIEMTQIIYLLTCKDKITTIDSMHGTSGLPNSPCREAEEIASMHDRSKPYSAPHEVKILSMDTSARPEKQHEIWKAEVKDYFNIHFNKTLKAAELLNNPQYKRSCRAVQIEIGKLALRELYPTAEDKKGLNHELLKER